MNILKKIWQYFCVYAATDTELMTSFRTSVDREFSVYLENLLQMEKEEIVARTGETWFYSIVYDYIMSCDAVNEIVLEAVDTDTPIEKMWNYCEKQELGSADWEDVDLIMEETFLHQGKTMEAAS